MIRLFCKRVLEKRPYSAKETHNLKEPTNHSHPIVHLVASRLLRISTREQECRLVLQVEILRSALDTKCTVRIKLADF